MLKTKARNVLKVVDRCAERSAAYQRVKNASNLFICLRIRSLCHRDTLLLPGLKEIYIPNFNNTSPGLDPSFRVTLRFASDSFFNLVHLDNSTTSDRQFCIPFLFLLSVNLPNLPTSLSAEPQICLWNWYLISETFKVLI